MRRSFAALAFVLASATPAWADGGQVRTPQAIARAAVPGTVMVVLSAAGADRTSQGSGFFVGDGLVVTNFHVIAGMSEGWVRVLGQERKIQVEGVVATDRQHDLAVLKVAETGIAALARGDDQDLAIADKIYAIGNPHGLEGTFSEGLLSSIRRVDQDTMLQISAPISQGSSGGPVLDDHGHVIGVAVGMLKDGQNLNFAIPVRYLEALLADVGRPQPLALVGADVDPSPGFAPGPPAPLPSAGPQGPMRGPGPVGADGRTPIDCGSFSCRLPAGWSLERNEAAASAFSATRRQGGFALLTVYFRDQARGGEVDDAAGKAIATLGDKYLKHRLIELGGERAYLIMYKAAMEAGPVFASDVRVVHDDVEYTISLWSDANATDMRAIGEDFESLAKSWVWK
jgi:hypothetical protein